MRRNGCISCQREKTTARDGRRFNLSDPDTVVQVFNKEAVDLPIDYEHQMDSATADRSGPVPAAGWIKELKTEETGLWGRVEWTDLARELITSKAYRYLSPSFLHTKKGNIVTRLKGAGLVHRPALHLNALASREDAMDGELVTRLISVLGLDDDADEADIVSAVEDLVENGAEADPSKYVPIEAVQDLISDRISSQASRSEEQAQAKVDEALSKGFITPAMKDWAKALCQRDEASFDAFISKSVPAYASLFSPVRPSGPPPTINTPLAQSPEAASVCSQLGLSPEALKE